MALIPFQENNPSHEWELPSIVPSEVYDLKWWHYKSASHIKISSVNIPFSDTEEPMHINLIEKHQIDWALKHGYKYAHLGAIHLGLSPLVHPSLMFLCYVLP